MEEQKQPNPQKRSPSKAHYIRVVHPTTRRFMFEYDPIRKTIMVSDAGERVCIDLIRLAEDAGFPS